MENLHRDMDSCSYNFKALTEVYDGCERERYDGEELPGSGASLDADEEVR